MQEKREAFTLKKVKRTKKGGLEVSYEILNGNGNRQTIAVESSKVAHPDLFKQLDDLMPIVVGILRVEEKTDDDRDRVTVTGVSVSGAGDTYGVIITATLMIEEGNTKIAVNTPRIDTAKSTYGIEGEVEDAVDVLAEEVFCYLFEDKQAQLELFPSVEVVEDEEVQSEE
jgi:hypothetical protein